MPVNRIKSVERTKIVVSGELPRQHIQEIFNQIVGPAPAVGFRYNYNKETDETEIRFVPCRVYTVDLPPEIEERFGDGISRERKIVIPGIIMGRDNINEIVERCWVPARKRAKKANDNLKWVVVMPRIVKDDEYKTLRTEISFIIESQAAKQDEKSDKKPKEPRGCLPKDVPETLDRATELVVEELRKLVGEDASYAMEAAHILDEVSMDFSETIEEMLYNS